MSRKLVLLLCLFSTLISSGQEKQVKVTMRSGSVITGNLKEFDPLDHVTIMIGEIETKIPMSEVAYLDQSGPSNNKPVNSEESNDMVLNPPTNNYNLQDYKGFLLEKGNSVFVYSDDKNTSKAGANEIKRLLNKDGFWHVVDNMSDAHFTINYIATFRKRDSAQLSISSWRTSNLVLLAVERPLQLELESTNIREAYEMYYNIIVPLQEKIANKKVSKNIKSKFTIP